MNYECALCHKDLGDTVATRKRYKKSKSKLLFCSSAHKNEALVLARGGDERFLSIVPAHYREKITLTCAYCNEIIEAPNYKLYQKLKNNKSGNYFCSVEHFDLFRYKRRLQISGSSPIIKPETEFVHAGKRTHKANGEKLKEPIYLYVRECEGCNKPFKGTHSQKFCERNCKFRSEALGKVNAWLNGDHDSAQSTDGSIKGWAREYLIKEVHYACSICRWSEVSANGTIPLEIDHIDGNWKNSARENLRVLCPNCHSLTKNYKIYNVGNNEQSRYSYWREKGWH